MLNISNEAIRKMYVACKENGCFPGDLPTEEHDQNVSIHSVLKGLGLLTDGILQSDIPISSDQSISKTSVLLPRANSGKSNPSMDGIDIYSLPNMNMSSSTSHHILDDPFDSPTTHTNSFDSSQQNHDIRPSFPQNLDFLPFSLQSHSTPVVSLASTNHHTMQLCDFLKFDTQGYQWSNCES